MKRSDAGDRKYKLLITIDAKEFEQQLNTSHEEGWELHSWTATDTYGGHVRLVALMVRITNRNPSGRHNEANR